MQQNTWVEKGEYCGSKWPCPSLCISIRTRSDPLLSVKRFLNVVNCAMVFLRSWKTRSSKQQTGEDSVNMMRHLSKAHVTACPLFGVCLLKAAAMTTMIPESSRSLLHVGKSFVVSLS